MFSAAIYLRYNMKKANRPFRIGNKGNGLMWFIAGLGFCGSLLAFSTGNSTVWFSVLIIGCIIVVVAPFIIYASKKPSWSSADSQFEPFHWEENTSATSTVNTDSTNNASQIRNNDTNNLNNKTNLTSGNNKP